MGEHDVAYSYTYVSEINTNCVFQKILKTGIRQGNDWKFSPLLTRTLSSCEVIEKICSFLLNMQSIHPFLDTYTQTHATVYCLPL